MENKESVFFGFGGNFGFWGGILYLDVVDQSAAISILMHLDLEDTIIQYNIGICLVGAFHIVKKA